MTTKTDKETTATKKPAVKKAPVKKTAAAKPAAANAASAKPVSKRSTAKADAVIKTKKTKNENKAIFAPLGKYALVGVIMVTLIVTTAIMLDKQLGNVEQEVAAIETDINKISYTTAAVETESATPEVSAMTAAPAAVATAPAETNIAETPDAKVLAQATTQEVKTESAATQPATQAATQPDAQQAAQITDSSSAADTTAARDERKARHEEMAAVMAAENKARIEASKLEQKQKMAEMFARIKTLEGKQLDRYKTGQDKQIESLRAQITRQQQQIERLEKRNKEIYEMRAASMQRNQVRREEALNRI